MLTDARHDRKWTILLVGLVVLPLVVSAIYLWFAVGNDYLPTVDWALFELQTRDVFDHGVLVGPYSRYGWNHPGPLMFYALALPYKLLGERSISMHITALGLNAATLGAIGWVAYRRGRLAGVITVLIPVALLTRALGPELLRDPWNPYLPVLPLLLLLLLAWSVAVGDLWMLPIAIGVASFTIQSHIGLSLESVAVLLVALAAVAYRGLRTLASERRAYWGRVGRVVAVSAGVFVVLWLPVAVDEIVRSDGNLGRIFEFFTSDHDTAGYRNALEVLGLQWGPRPEWFLGPRGFAILGNAYVEARWWLAVWLGLGALAVVIAVRRRSTETLWLAAVVGVGLIAAVIAVSNVVGLLYPYLSRWTWVLGAALGILVLQGAWLAVPPAHRAAVLRWALPLAVLTLGVISVVEIVGAIDAGTPYASAQRRERTISAQVLARLPDGDGPVLIDTAQGGVIAPGIALQLERRGIPVEVRPSQPIVYGEWRNSDDGPYRAELVVVLGDEEIRKFDPPGPRIAHFVRPANAADREARRQFLAQARLTPPGPARDALLAVAERARVGPAEEVAVYLVERGR